MQTNARRFEMIEGSSSKFWEVKVEGPAFTVTYGRIGTAGVSKTTTCASPAAAQAEADKLIREKTKKGYQELGSAPVFRPPAHIDSASHPERFLNYKVTGFDPGADPDDEGDEDRPRDLAELRDLDKRAFRIAISYDDDDSDFPERLAALFADKRAGELRALVIGQWFSEVCEDGPEGLVEGLVAHGRRLGALKGLFIGDVIQEENEISWLHHVDYGAALSAVPSLEHVVIRGGQGLRLSGLKLPNLRSLTIQSGGLGADVLADILAADLPELRALTLWLGVEEYGGTIGVDDLAPLLSGEKLPKLDHLGLQDSANADTIAAAVATSRLLGRLSGLDLSMGTLSDVGGEALLATPQIRNLKHLNLRHHYLSPEVTRRFQSLGIEVDVRERQEGDDDDRYVEVSE